jgi:hypothetical protein
MNHKGFGKIANAMMMAKPEKTRAGHQRINMDPDTLMPIAPAAPAVGAMGKKPQTPAQHASVEKAATASRTKRKIAAGLPLTPKGF